jgi:pyruvate,orthophosphate dikinase
MKQLWGAIAAVFKSWRTPRAVSYRRIHGLPDDWGTAVNVQAMVFGNLGETSATGVAFTRSPATGQKDVFGEYLVNAQGEDVVAGIRTPGPMNLAYGAPEEGQKALCDQMPEIYRRFEDYCDKIEHHYRDMQDIEFTVEDGRLWILQTRAGKRTAQASVKIAVDLAREKIIARREALLHVSPDDLDQLMHPRLDPEAETVHLSRGLPASPGAAAGHPAFTAEEAVERAGKGEAVILVRQETSPEDIEGMNAAKGILTATGGMTSHAAVVARGMGKPCVAGAGDLIIDAGGRKFRVGDKTFGSESWVTLDGGTGAIYEGAVPTLDPEMSEEFRTLMEWADEFRRLGVRTNADTPKDAARAREFGAEGIGLTRTEHMFFGDERMPLVRRMILADTDEGRQEALDGLLPHQRADFEGILEAMDGLPVTIRLLDPPLHEFLPHLDDEEELKSVAKSTGIGYDALRERVVSLREMNPMLGHRGCRLGITFPAVYRMQVRAIFEAAAALVKKGLEPWPEVMIPLVGLEAELRLLRAETEEVAREVLAEAKVELPHGIVIGTMIEIPRAAVRAGHIAEQADFFSFGTNDLTQLTFGYSRDDAGKFLPHYVTKGLLAKDPFVSIDRRGVGELVEMGTERGRASKPSLKVGICGEHGGDPLSVEFFHHAGLDYVSCSPFRVPVARLAAAQAAIRDRAEVPDREEVASTV